MVTTPLPTSGVRQAPVLLWLRLSRVYHRVAQASTEHMKQFGINTAQFDILAHVGADEGMTQQDLADGLLVTKGNVCQLLDRLEACGFIERRQEGRSNRLFLTASGHDLYDRVVPEHERLIAELFQELTVEEQRHVLHALRKVDRCLK